MAYVYRHIRLDKNEPFYIGIGKLPNYKRAFEKQKRNQFWQNIVAKTDYEVEILFDDISWEEAEKKEIEFISLYGRINNNTGILSNMTDGGDGFIGYIPSKEKIEKHKIFMTGRKQSQEEKQKRNESRKGYLHSEETKLKISNSHKGKKTSREHLEKLYKGQILANSKPINQYDLEGNFIREWQSATIAAKEINLHPTSIRHCVQGKTKTSGGYIWKAQISYK
jgi:hypothetical protein